MSDYGIDVKVKNFPDFKAALLGLPDKLRQRALRNALSAGARIVRDEAKRNAPVLDRAIYSSASGLKRKPGTLKNAIKVRTSKTERRLGNVGVYVNVKPAAKALRGTNMPSDPFYWRWLEFGRTARAKIPQRGRGFKEYGSQFYRRARRAYRAVGAIKAMHFLQSGADKFSQALDAIEAELANQINKLGITK